MQQQQQNYLQCPYIYVAFQYQKIRWVFVADAGRVGKTKTKQFYYATEKGTYIFWNRTTIVV
jgi:hypothetical protein